MTSEVEATVEYLKRLIAANRKAVFWGLFTITLFWLVNEMKEVTLLLFVSYAIALLIDPLVTKLERKGIRRGLSVVLLATFIFIVIAVFLGVAIPQVIAEYSILAKNFPHYVESLREWLAAKTSVNLKVQEFFAKEQFWSNIKSYASYLGEERIASWLKTLGETLLSGYSLALTLLNLILLPFFIYYIACDLHVIHRVVGGYLPTGVRSKVAEIGGEIVDHTAVFFRGQMLVALILACLYVFGLFLVGLPSALFVGVTAGFLGIVPYLGICVGVFLATLITIVNDPSWTQLFAVWTVFAVVQGLEGTIITPKIVGERLGIHPLGVMLAIIVGGQLLGLLGVFIAIPAAAAVRVLFRHAMTVVEKSDGSEIILDPSKLSAADRPILPS